MGNIPEVSVGIVSADKIVFSLNSVFSAKGETVEGIQTVEYSEGGIRWNGNLYQDLTFHPQKSDASFTLFEVTIGVNFHWERKENQVFTGCLSFIVYDGRLCAINILPVEDYLVSVISSEMSAKASLNFLKAHAVISRSWLLAQIDKRKNLQNKPGDAFFSVRKSDTQLIRWYDREDHTEFDVCADDHCQRYQGITRAVCETASEAVRATQGMVLMHDSEICDARFSKCCGGVTEEYSTCWEDIDKPYLKSIADKSHDSEIIPDLSDENQVREWIMSSPEAFCNTDNEEVLSQVLNNYDQETENFYRWTVEYTQSELSELLKNNLKMDFGEIVDLIPLKRGKSGRISVLRIVGTERTFEIGKELEIRRVLSDSHLLSSAFVVDCTFSGTGAVPSAFVLHGAGWGHGVGLCQIGAAVMGEKGIDYKAILMHYYRGAELKKLY